MRRTLCIIGAVLLAACGCQSPQAPTVTAIDRSPAPPFAALDRPLVFSLPLIGYAGSRFGFGGLVQKDYQEDELGAYFVVWDWKTETFKAKSFFEGWHYSTNREAIYSEPAGKYYTGSQAQGLVAGLAADTGALSIHDIPRTILIHGRATKDGYLLLNDTNVMNDGVGLIENFYYYNTVNDTVELPPITIATYNSGSISNSMSDDTNDFWLAAESNGMNGILRLDPRERTVNKIYEESVIVEAYPDLIFEFWPIGIFSKKIIFCRAPSAPLGITIPSPSPTSLYIFDTETSLLERIVDSAIVPGHFPSLSFIYDEKLHVVFCASEITYDQSHIIYVLDVETGELQETGMSYAYWSSSQDFYIRDDYLFLFNGFSGSVFTGACFDLVQKKIVNTYSVPLSEILETAQ